jgi:hypothetical protein
MSGRRKYPTRPAVLVLAVLVLALSAGSVLAGTLLKDDFDDGIVDTSVFVAIGNAVITESGGQLHIQTFGIGDGVEIVVPKNAACVQLNTEIPEVEFDRFEGFGVSAFFTDTDGNELLGVGAELLRPFWNRCQVTWKFGDQTQTEGIWG